MSLFPRTLLALSVAAAVCLAATPGDAGAAGMRSFSLGVFEGDALNTPSPADGDILFSRMRAAGARYARTSVNWRDIAPAGATKPAGFDARDPADPLYSWAALDAFVRGATAKGLAPIVTTLYAPRWAEGPGAKSDDPAYRPDPKAYGEFAYALAKRYSGSFPDPLRPGRALPRVRYFQVWNEPNFNRYLTPEKVGSRIEGPSMYVDLLNAFYDAVKSVSRTDVVIGAGMGPFGNNGGRTDMDPQVFIRDVLCLKGTPVSQIARRPCGHAKARFDVWAQHPYTLEGTPSSKGISPNAGAVGNVPQIKATLDRAVALKTIGVPGPKPLWVTEIDWMTDPPGLLTSGGQLGKKPAVQARYLSEAAYRLWRAGVATMIWFQLRDAGQIEAAASWPGGLYFAGQTVAQDQPKPSLQAFSMPFYAARRSTGLYAWALVERGGSSTRVEVQRLSGGRWVAVGTLRADAGGLARGTVGTARAGTYRAVARTGLRKGLVSYTYRVA